MVISRFLAAATFVCAANAWIPLLTTANWHETLDGKNAFIMYETDWCGACKKAKPELELVNIDFQDRKFVVIGRVNCGASPKLCSDHDIQGYPTFKTFKYKAGHWKRESQEFMKANPKGKKYNGEPTHQVMSRYLESTLGVKDCHPEDRKGCGPEELKVIDSLTKMDLDQRRAKIRELQESVKAKRAELTKMMADKKAEGWSDDMMEAAVAQPLAAWESMQKALDLANIMGDGVVKLTDDKEFKTQCGQRTCVISFLSSDKHDESVGILDAVRQKAANSGTPIGFMWLRGGDFKNIEKKLKLPSNYPATVALSWKKKKFGVHNGTFDEASLTSFLKDLMYRASTMGLTKLPKGFKWPNSTTAGASTAQSESKEDL